MTSLGIIAVFSYNVAATVCCSVFVARGEVFYDFVYLCIYIYIYIYIYIIIYIYIYIYISLYQIMF